VSKKERFQGGTAEAETPGAAGAAESGQQAEPATIEAPDSTSAVGGGAGVTEERGNDVIEIAPYEPGANYTMFIHNNGGHPDGRASYTIPGVKGNMVIFPTLLEDGLFPPTLELFTRDDDGLLVPVKLTKGTPKVDKAVMAAVKLQEKADKAAAKLVEMSARLKEAQDKRAAALAEAKAKVEAAAKVALGGTSQSV